jgi:hypothetical protein
MKARAARLLVASVVAYLPSAAGSSPPTLASAAAVHPRAPRRWPAQESKVRSAKVGSAPSRGTTLLRWLHLAARFLAPEPEAVALPEPGSSTQLLRDVRNTPAACGFCFHTCCVHPSVGEGRFGATSGSSGDSGSLVCRPTSFWSTTRSGNRRRRAHRRELVLTAQQRYTQQAPRPPRHAQRP